MSRNPQRPNADRRLVQIVDAALAENASRCGEWLACRPGCCQCCIGVFEISQLDAVRLREGMAELERSDPARAAAVRRRAADSRARLGKTFPGDSRSGVLNGNEEEFENFGNDEPCPALDPETGTCELYAHRPMTCRVFGPPVRSEGGLGVCELCFVGAPQEEIEKCELVADPQDLESRIAEDFEKKLGQRGKTVVAWALK
jgi:Fe-S-cluster containining protein